MDGQQSIDNGGMYYLFPFMTAGTEALVLCSYHMHLWGKMAAQRHLQTSQNAHNHRQPPTSSTHSTPGHIRRSLRSCQESIQRWDPAHIHHIPTPPGSPNLAFKGTSDRDVERFREKEKDREQREQSPALVVLAGQALFRSWEARSAHLRLRL